MGNVIRDELLEQLSQRVNARLGLRYAPERWRDLERGIESAAGDFGFDDVERCAEWMASAALSKSEIEKLASHLTVGETYFFRDRQLMQMLEAEILPPLIAERARSTRALRFWSAGCSSGEEPYSLAILLAKMLPAWREWNITIHGSDINPRFLRKATLGIYRDWSFRDTPAWVKERCFEQVDKRAFEILPQFKEMVTFSCLNLVDDPYPSLINHTNAIDIILCRNVLMYFSGLQAQRVIRKFHHALVENGRLIVSPTETSPGFYGEFEPEYIGGLTFYRKRAHRSAAEEPEAQPVEWPAPPEGVSSRALSAVVREEEPVGASPPFAEEIWATATRLYAAGEYGGAVAQLHSLLAEEPGNTRASALLARAYANQGELDAALHWCDRAIALEKLEPELHYLRATVLQEKGSMNDSVASLKRAIYLDADFALAYFALGNLENQRGRMLEGRRHLETTLAVLARHPAEKILPGADGMTMGRLGELVRAAMEQEQLA